MSAPCQVREQGVNSPECQDSLKHALPLEYGFIAEAPDLLLKKSMNLH